MLTPGAESCQATCVATNGAESLAGSKPSRRNTNGSIEPARVPQVTTPTRLKAGRNRLWPDPRVHAWTRGVAPSRDVRKRSRTCHKNSVDVRWGEWYRAAASPLRRHPLHTTAQAQVADMDNKDEPGSSCGTNTDEDPDPCCGLQGGGPVVGAR